MNASLSADVIARVKSTVPTLVAHGPEITAAMYARLFEDAHIRALFNHSNQRSGAQVHALSAAIIGYASNIEDLSVLAPVVERIAQKHIGYDILPEHYPFVGRALLAAIRDVLGAGATDDVLEAWGEAYGFLANVLQGRETLIRETILAEPGGWTGWRSFVIESRVRESEVITSFILRPEDGGAVLRHRAGQYLTLRIDTPEEPGLKRNYSISAAANGATYRISVKREPEGRASNYLHDRAEVGMRLELTPPAGDFHLPDDPERPVVLLSGGVGLTPMVSMLETIVSDHPHLETHFVHGALSGETHAMAAHVRDLAGTRDTISSITFYSEPGPDDVLGASHDHAGLISVDWLKAHTPFDVADFYLCGPRPFLHALVHGLRGAGVPSDRLHFETFGPADSSLSK